eukprot:s4132_g1.t1
MTLGIGNGFKKDLRKHGCSWSGSELLSPKRPMEKTGQAGSLKGELKRNFNKVANSHVFHLLREERCNGQAREEKRPVGMEAWAFICSGAEFVRDKQGTTPLMEGLLKLRVNPSDEGIARAVSTVAQKCDASEFTNLARMEFVRQRSRVPSWSWPESRSPSSGVPCRSRCHDDAGGRDPHRLGGGFEKLQFMSVRGCGRARQARFASDEQMRQEVFDTVDSGKNSRSRATRVGLALPQRLAFSTFWRQRVDED